MNQTLDLLKEPMVQDALKAALMVAVVCSYLGVFVVLKRIVFVGAALAEVASLGAALALTPPALGAFGMLIGALPVLEPLDHFRPLVLAMTLMLISVAFFSQQRRSRRLPQEAIIGTVVAAATGLTLLVLSNVQSQDQHTIDVLQGSILGVEAQELTELAIASLVIGLVQALFYKEFVLVSFDPEVARTLGYRSSRWELLWYVSLGTMIAVSIHAAGTVLVFSYLTLPPVAALLLSRRLGHVLTLSVFLAVVATCAGMVLSVAFNVPTSYAIVGCSAALFALCWTGRALVGLRGTK